MRAALLSLSILAVLAAPAVAGTNIFVGPNGGYGQISVSPSGSVFGFDSYGNVVMGQASTGPYNTGFIQGFGRGYGYGYSAPAYNYGYSNGYYVPSTPVIAAPASDPQVFTGRRGRRLNLPRHGVTRPGF